MLTKKQKSQQIEESKKIIQDNKTLVFIDFTGTIVDDIKKLRRILLGIGSNMKVIKKKLLRVAFKESNLDFNPEQFDSQVATISTQKDISELAGPIYKFSKEIKNKNFKILGGYDLLEKSFIEAEMVRQIGQLPSREVLFGKVVGMLASPIKMFLYILDQKSKQTVEKL